MTVSTACEKVPRLDMHRVERVGRLKQVIHESFTWGSAYLTYYLGT